MPNLKFKIRKTVDESYDIPIVENSTAELIKFLKKNNLGNAYAIIADEVSEKLFGRALLGKLRKEKIKCELFSFKAGEKSKSLKTVEELAEKMITKQFTRKDAIIALGGGVVGDIAGFLASIYFRGIPFVQIPTTLLAMVDSSVGGKTGVDLKSGKNLIGTFHQPKTVIIGRDFLKTLPRKQIASGLAEIIKCGVIADKSLFEFIEKNLDKIYKLETSAINFIIEKSLKVKIDIVQSDEKETSQRMLLNYGHTYGHALEKLSNYTLLHGFAISIGMVIVNEMAVAKKLLKRADAERIKKLLKLAGLPVTTIKKPQIKDLLSDKKREGDHINFVLPVKIGKAIIFKEKVI